MKRKFTYFFVFFYFALFLFSGCSKNKIDNISIVEDSIKKEYIVQEEVDIDNFKIKIKYTDDTVEEYLVNENMFTLKEIDNTIVGEQDLTITLDYNKNKFDLVVVINFKLPSSVNTVIEMIDNIPDNELLKFSDENLLSEVKAAYNHLDDKYKVYVSNYGDLEAKIDYLNEKRTTTITPEVTNQRYVYISALDTFLESLNQEDYTIEAWGQIVGMHNTGVTQLNNDDNYNIMHEIMITTKMNILNVKTKNELSFNELKDKLVYDLLRYRNEFDNEKYSHTKFEELELIVSEGINNIVNSVSEIEANNKFIEACEKLDIVPTIDEEKQISLNNLIADKINEATQYYLSINLSYYDAEGKTALNNYLNICQSNIKNSLNEEDMNDYIDILKKQINSVLTISEKNQIALQNYKKDAITSLNSYFDSINLYEYTTNNRTLITSIIEKAKEDVDMASSKENIDEIIETVINEIDSIMTIEEQSLANLSSRIDSYLAQVDEYITSYNQNNYSTENWKVILNIVQSTKEYLQTITITTSDVFVNNYLNARYDEIDNVLTLEEQTIEIINNAKKEAKERLDTYYKSLNQSDYTDSAWTFITNKIETSISMIDSLTDISSIDRLVEETINSIKII